MLHVLTIADLSTKEIRLNSFHYHAMHNHHHYYPNNPKIQTVTQKIKRFLLDAKRNHLNSLTRHSSKT